MYQVDFYTLPSGRSPVAEFMDNCQKPLRKKILREIRYLKQFGVSKDNPNLRKLTGTPLWEVRILGNDSTRLICVIVFNGKIVVVNVFKKKGKKTPQRELLVSLERYKRLTTDI